MQIILTNTPLKSDTLIILGNKKTDWKKLRLPKNDIELILSHQKKELKQIALHTKGNVFISILDEKKNAYQTAEEIRKAGFVLLGLINKHKITTVTVQNESGIKDASLFFVEGMTMGNYQFIKYKKDVKKLSNSLSRIKLLSKDTDKKSIHHLQAEMDAVYLVRDLVNEPVNYLNAQGLANAILSAGEQAGFKVDIFNKKKIEQLKMGGLLAVNQGSIDPPTFTVMEYKPENALNEKPIVLVGKGVVYDTGGLSLKPTGNSMDYMKCDMAGAATVTGAVYTAARTKLPLHLIGLVPSTDNRPGGNAFAPGDIITMYNGMTVEMLNSDAEGRMILGDALAYAKQFNPELVIDVATLTGAAHRALGDYAIAYMSTAGETVDKQLEESGMEVYERLVGFPLWDEYGDMLKSDIADIKNIGGAMAGQITAGKFLEEFTDYPWIHLDIAGIAFFHSQMNYKGKNASAFGLRLLNSFLKKRVKEFNALDKK